MRDPAVIRQGSEMASSSRPLAESQCRLTRGIRHHRRQPRPGAAAVPRGECRLQGAVGHLARRQGRIPR
jgi:hypothetical protein